MERRQHPARLGDLRRISHVEEITADDGEDAERHVTQLDPEAAVSGRNWSSDRDAFVMKPRQEGRRVGQVPEPLWGGSASGGQVCLEADQAV